MENKAANFDQTIDALLHNERKAFNAYFRKNMSSEVPYLQSILDHILLQNGKHIRPTMVFLSAKMHGQAVGERTYIAAIAIEMLHTASLVHDDVVDDANERRGVASVNALFQSKTAVLAGDYLLAKALLLITDNRQFEALSIITNPVKVMTEGELFQMEKAQKLDTTEADYLEIIRRKTATLLSSCAACGALSVDAPKEVVDEMEIIGEYIGMAFQICDDIFDYEQNASQVGKPVGHDLREGKLTLPLIHALAQVNDNERQLIIDAIRLLQTENNDEYVQQIIDFTREKGGIAYAREKMQWNANKAIEMLRKYPESEAREAYIDLANYVTQRTK